MRMDPDGGLSGPFKDLVNLYVFDFFGAFTILMPLVANEAKKQRSAQALRLDQDCRRNLH